MKSFALAVLVFVAASSVGAQSLSPVANDLGIGGSVSSSSNEVQLFYHLSDSILLVPQLGFFTYNFADTSGGSTVNFPGTWLTIGAGVYFVVLPFQSLSIQIGPALQFATEAYQVDGNPIKYQFTYFQAQVNLQLFAMITRNFGFFGAVGVYLYSSDTKDTTNDTDTRKTGFGIVSPSLGVAFYFK